MWEQLAAFQPVSIFMADKAPSGKKIGNPCSSLSLLQIHASRHDRETAEHHAE